MPELPEIETIVRGLAKLHGQRIEDVKILDRHLCLPLERIRGSRIVQITRRGKYIVVCLTGNRALIFHLRMSGRLVFAPARHELKHTRLILHLEGGALYFVNPRRLGTVECSEDGFPHRLGVEPLGQGFTTDCLAKITSVSRRPIKPLLMDQQKIAGIGNIYSAEALWHAGIDPRRAGNTLARKEIRMLHSAIMEVLQEAIHHMGTTFADTVSDYRDTSGNRGRFQDCLAVYNREGEPCRRCNRTIERIVQGGRSTYFCPSCQC